MFAITYMYYSVLGTVITIVVGVLVSWTTRSDEDKYEAKLLHPYVTRLARYMNVSLKGSAGSSSDCTSNVPNKPIIVSTIVMHTQET